MSKIARARAAIPAAAKLSNLDDVALILQDILNVDDGGVAGMCFSDIEEGVWEAMSEHERGIRLHAYLEVEIMYGLKDDAPVPVVITPLDLAWEEINALGGYVEPGDKVGEAENSTIGKALNIIERLGGSDPVPRRARARAIEAELRGIADDIAALKPEACGHG